MLKNQMTSRRLIAGALALLAATSAARADDPADALRQRFQARLPAVRSNKDAGRLGETAAGLIDAVDPAALQDAALKQLVDAENADRAALYRLIAAKDNTTPDLVADRNAQRNFARAQKGDYLKGKDNVWTRKG